MKIFCFVELTSIQTASRDVKPGHRKLKHALSPHKPRPGHWLLLLQNDRNCTRFSLKSQKQKCQKYIPDIHNKEFRKTIW
jgi:hypothetical protein